MNKKKQLLSGALCAVCLAVSLPVAAEGWRPDGYLVQAAVGEDRTASATLGLSWAWAWKYSLLGAEVSGLTEAYISHWNAPSVDGGRRGFVQVGVVPVLRLRPGEGASPWFAEAGIGLSTMDRHFETTTKKFSMAFNFVDVVGIGRSFGAARSQEIGIRLQHVSNGSLRPPNPGQNFVQLRYAAAF